jgi:hypothetical protein
MGVVSVATTGATLTDMQRDFLRGIHFDLLIQEVERRGHQVCLHTICRFSRDRLPTGWPPLADEEGLPFDASEDTRS